jgi:thiol-disulfide isomerase/thioredoxin
MRPLPAAATRRRRALPLVALLALFAGAVAARLVAQEDWRLAGLDGGALAAGDVAHGSTVLVVFAGWSPHCKEIVGKSNALVDHYGSRARVVLVDFQEEPGEVRGFLQGKGSRAAVYLDADGSFAKDHHVATLPGLVVFKDGAVAFAGRLPDDAERAVGDALGR